MVKKRVLKFIGFLESLQSIPFLGIRLGLGALFAISGWGKLNSLPQVIDYFQSIEIPAASVLAPLVAILELVAGAAVFLGYGSRLASLLLAFLMVIALGTAKRSEITDFISLWEISEFLYIFLFALIATHGPGKFALERILHRHWKV